MRELAVFPLSTSTMDSISTERQKSLKLHDLDILVSKALLTHEKKKKKKNPQKQQLANQDAFTR